MVLKWLLSILMKNVFLSRQYPFDKECLRFFFFFFFCFTNLCLFSGEIAESNRHKVIDLHDDIIKWKHFRVTGPLALCEGNPQVTLKKDSGAEPWCFFVLFCFVLFYQRLSKWWSNNRGTDDLRRHRAHYGVTVMDTNPSPNPNPTH